MSPVLRCSYCKALLPIERPSEFAPAPEFCSIACETNAYAEMRAEFEEYERAAAAGSSLPLDPFPRMILPPPRAYRWTGRKPLPPMPEVVS